jgi:hypothetical protein
LDTVLVDPLLRLRDAMIRTVPTDAPEAHGDNAVA